MGAYHLSRLTFKNNEVLIRDSLPDELLFFLLQSIPSFADLVNLVAGQMPQQ